MNKNGAREEFLKARIKERGTMKEFAASIDMPYTTLWSILQNVGGAAIDNVIKICHGLGFPVAVLEDGAKKLSVEPPNTHAFTEIKDEREDLLVTRYRKLDPDDKNTVDLLVKDRYNLAIKKNSESEAVG